MNIDSGMLISYIISMMLKKIVVPSDFHGQADAISNMLGDDVSGLVDSLTDFAVDTATVDFNIESDNDEFSKIIKQWLDTINIDINTIPSGITPLAKEYFKERWKGASFPVLKIAKWGQIKGVAVPTEMFFVDGGSIHAKDIDEKDENLKLINYNYYLGSKLEEENKLGDNCIFAKYSGRWFDKYPVPYLIKRGVYHNWKIIHSLKGKETEILEQIIPYMLLVKKGTEGLAINDIKTYSNEELREVVNQLQELMDEIKTTSPGDKKVKAPIRATMFDEELKHLIPNLTDIFSRELFIVAEKSILSALGFIDVVEAVSTSRRESILNPKVFIEEVRSGVEDFKQIMKELVLLIQRENSSHVKYMNSKFYITSSPIKGFMTDDFKEKIRQLYDRGRISSQTAVELIAEVDFRTEVYRREKEAQKGIDETMYPPVRENREGQGIDLPSDITGDGDEEEVPDDKKDEIEKQNYNIEGKKELEGAPYQTIKDLPSRVKNNLSPNLQRTFLSVFNKALQTYKNETRAFRVAWSVIRKIGKKGKNGKWVRKSSKTKLNKAMLEEVLEQEEKTVIEETIKAKELEIKDKQSKLLDKLLNKSKE